MRFMIMKHDIRNVSPRDMNRIVMMTLAGWISTIELSLQI